MGVDGTPLPPASAAALQDALAAQDARMPTKGEQRRIASLQFAVAARGAQGFETAKDLIRYAEQIDKFISNGPNS